MSKTSAQRLYDDAKRRAEEQFGTGFEQLGRILQQALIAEKILRTLYIQDEIVVPDSRVRELLQEMVILLGSDQQLRPRT